jgi:YidC/Oxa1 family membrane protein insertase
MEKNLLKAIVLSAAILLGWQFFASRFVPQPPQPQQAQQQPAAPADAPAPAPSTPAVTQSAAPVTAPASAEPERNITVETSRWVAQFTNRGGVPTSWKLVRGPNGEAIKSADGSDLELIPAVGVERVGAPLRLAVPGDDAATKRLAETTYAVTARSADGADVPADGALRIDDGQTVELAFAAPDPATNQIVTKRYALTGGQYDFRLVVDSSAGPRPFALVVGPRVGDQSVRTEGTYTHTPPYAVVGTADGKTNTIHGGDVADGQQKAVDGVARWVGVTDNYFAMSAATVDAQQGQAVVSNAKLKYEDSEPKPHDFLSVALPVDSGKPVHVFVGPKDPGVLDAVSAHATAEVGAPVDLGSLVNYGFFARIVKPIVPVINAALNFTNKITGNYGWSIIIVTALFNLLFFPLRYKSTVSMKRAAKLQPRMKELQEKLKKYKPTDPQFKELQQEQMALMREGNPLGGCLPMLVQFPFFWAFFIYFTTTFVVRQQPWIGWVTDLTAPDHYYILPVLMCAAQIGSTMIMPMPQSDDPAMKMQRRLMTWVMPVVITYFFLVAAPSGLVLYWMTLNLVGIGVQYSINKMLPPDVQQAPEPAGGKGKKPKKNSSSAELVGSEK